MQFIPDVLQKIITDSIINYVGNKYIMKGVIHMSKGAAIVLTIFLGELGIHRFLAGKIGTGILWLLTGGVFGIGWIVDIVKVCTGKFTDKNGNPWGTN